MKPRKTMRYTRSQGKMAPEASMSRDGEDGVGVKMGSILTGSPLYSLQCNHLP